MSNKRCFQYNGQYYDIGTKVILKTKYKGEVITTYLGDGRFDGFSIYDYPSGVPSKYYIKEIIEPIYYQEDSIEESKKSNIFIRTGSGSWGAHDDIFHGLLLYVAVMLGGIIFNDRWLIWIAATIIFFGWKAKK